MKKFVERRTKCPKEFIADLHKKISFFASDFKKRWLEANRKQERFFIKNKNWLDTSISFLTYDASQDKKQGRPQKSFGKSADRTKRKKTESMRTKHSPEELSFATHMSLRSVGKVEASKVVKEITATTPTRAAKYRTAYKSFNVPQRTKLTGTEALAMYVDAKLSRHQYNIIRENDKLRFPSYKEIQSVKKECYPPKESIIVTDTVAEVKLQALLDHTASRLLEAQKEVLESQRPENLQNLLLICKWGFDGSAISEYKQKFSNDSNATDANIFISSLVPIRLISDKPEDKQPVIFWQNQRTSSTRYCRPIRFQFAHETTDLSKKERDYIDGQIQELRPMIYEFHNTQIEVNYKMLFTMVDGKVCNAVTETTSTQRCFICRLTSKDFNNIGKVLHTNIVDTSRLEFGLSVLHAWIRLFECLLHIAYKLPLKKWQIRGDENKQIVANTKKCIQDKFKSDMGLLIDKPKPGFGSTNDGNTARRFFSNPELSASITGIDINIIQKFKIVLQAISSGHEIDVKKYRAYALDTAKLFVKKYSWYPMPPSVHKVLIHGPDIIKHALVPIGQLSEEAQEARNKEFKKYRECFSRKISRSKTNEDVLNLLLITSDPLITSLRKLPKKKATQFDRDVLNLLISPDIIFSLDNDGQRSVSGNESDDSVESL